MPFVEYFPVRETAAPKIMVSPSTFENEADVVPKIGVDVISVTEADVVSVTEADVVSVTEAGVVSVAEADVVHEIEADVFLLQKMMLFIK